MQIALIGYMGCGKSQVGQALARDLNLQFADLDVCIEQKASYTISKIMKEEGEIAFRKQERTALLELLNEKDLVISTGGGTPCYYNNMEEINAQAQSFYLQMGVPALYENLKEERAHRPLIAHLRDEELREFIGKHLMERGPFYEQAKFRIGADFTTTEKRIEEIKRLLK